MTIKDFKKNTSCVGKVRIQISFNNFSYIGKIKDIDKNLDNAEIKNLSVTGENSYDIRIDPPKEKNVYKKIVEMQVEVEAYTDFEANNAIYYKVEDPNKMLPSIRCLVNSIKNVEEED